MIPLQVNTGTDHNENHPVSFWGLLRLTLHTNFPQLCAIWRPLHGNMGSPTPTPIRTYIEITIHVPLEGTPIWKPIGSGVAGRCAALAPFNMAMSGGHSETWGGCVWPPKTVAYKGRFLFFRKTANFIQWANSIHGTCWGLEVTSLMESNCHGG